MMKNCGLDDEEVEALRGVFARNSRVKRAVLYGSRAKGTYRPFSDMDITLEGDELTYDDLLDLSMEIDDLLLPYELDMNLRKNLKNAALIEHIDRVGIPLYER